MKIQMFKSAAILIVAIVISSCNSNTIIYEASPSKENLNLIVTNASEFKLPHPEINQYLTESEAYKTTVVQYRIGKTIGFKELYFLKPMMKNYKAKEGTRTELTIRSYNHSNALIDELTLSRTDNDTIFSGKIFEDLTVEKYVNDVKTNYLINSEGKFQIVK
ncbi:hypothetical protein BBFL7_00965 [Flavobacteria bacterium BBFL7]|nr:hypothetical protein BBFL7_00965 [Flavobacteria bacterium BBFL7]